MAISLPLRKVNKRSESDSTGAWEMATFCSNYVAIRKYPRLSAIGEA